MAKKTTFEYKRVFEKICESVVEFRPETLMIDMEQAVVTAIIQKFPDCLIQFCFFHYKPSIWRWIQANGMSSKYSHENNIWFRQFINQHICLAFIPPNDVVEAFECLQQAAEEHLEDSDVEAFTGYFESNFIGRIKRNGTRSTPRHQIHMWNQFENAMNDNNRTNNSVEGWHHSIQSISNCHHPLFGKFLDVLKEDMINSRVKIVQNQTGVNNPPQRSTYRMLNEH